jgi:DNA-binding response OmpR family regulator
MSKSVFWEYKYFMKQRILLVDDELAILLTLKAVLEIHGFDVETAASAREAKSKLKANEYHMVITDMRMESDTAGLEVVQAAKKAPYHPAVAMLTAYPIPGSEWQDQGMDQMLVKPMNTSDLLLQLESLLVSHEEKKQKAAQSHAKAEGGNHGKPALVANGEARKTPAAKKAVSSRNK